MVETRPNPEVKGAGQVLLGPQLEQKRGDTEPRGSALGDLSIQTRDLHLMKFRHRFPGSNMLMRQGEGGPPPDWLEGPGRGWWIQAGNLASSLVLAGAQGLCFKWGL